MVSKEKNQRRRVAIFGGSFNPPHRGHTAILKWLFMRGIADEVWVIPCFLHPFGKELADFVHRLTMCRLAFSNLSLPVSVFDIEKKLGGISYTCRTIEHLKALHPDCRFLLVTGDDVKADTSEWKNFEKVKDLVEIIRVPRGVSSPIPDVSSTEIRDRLKNRKSYSELVEPEVAVYIVTKDLYR